jgi:hypothetical protein
VPALIVPDSMMSSLPGVAGVQWDVVGREVRPPQVYS